MWIITRSLGTMCDSGVQLLLLGLSAAVLLRSGKVYAQAVCQHNVQHTQANCSNRGLDSVYWGLHSNIEVLDLSSNNFTELTAWAFKKYNNLTMLYLRNNSISTIHPMALANLQHLRTLDLSQNHLVSVPTPMLNNLPSLYTLSLASNNIMLVSDASFSQLTQLKTLDLSGNRISELEPHALVNLTKLQKLNMAYNSLRSLPKETFELLSPVLLDVRLHSNPWICDCRIRWMHLWMTNRTGSIWQHPGEAILCDGPTISRGKPVSSIPLDELACKVEMRTSGSSQTVDKGEEAVMECIYFSIPIANPIWHKNDMPINAKARPEKYTVTAEGTPLTVTKLHVKDFQYDDIAAYECIAQNVRGSDSTVFKVTLTGVLFSSVSIRPPSPSSAGVDTKSIVVAVAVVCGIILIIVLSVLIFCCVTHIRRREQEKRDAVVENVKKHFMANGELAPKEHSEPDKSMKEQDEVDKAKLDQFDDTNSESTRTNDTNTTQPLKHALEANYPSDKEPLYTFRHPQAPFTNGNTYVSFGSEMTEPESLQMYSHPRANSIQRYDSSHTESTTPLLDRYTPSVFDSDDPFDATLQHPVYEAATLYYPKRNHFPGVNGSVPPLTPGSTRNSTRSTTFIPAISHHPDYQDYRDMRYPYNISPEQYMLASKKSMSVGNLGYHPAPRKPPRVFQSREYVEMSPHDTSGSASDYMSVPDQAYYYGIKPGTPV